MTRVIHKQFGPSFAERVLQGALAIPFGRVCTYGHLARQAGGSGQAARSVSAILAKYEQKNSDLDIPWHRIVYADGRVWLGEKEKIRRKQYKAEGIEIDKKGKIINFYDILFTFD
ncbi:MAG: MGMT family protein [Patescibacteria group bacterium]